VLPRRDVRLRDGLHDLGCWVPPGRRVSPLYRSRRPSARRQTSGRSPLQFGFQSYPVPPGLVSPARMPRGPAILPLLDCQIRFTSIAPGRCQRLIE